MQDITPCAKVASTPRGQPTWRDTNITFYSYLQEGESSLPSLASSCSPEEDCVVPVVVQLADEAVRGMAASSFDGTTDDGEDIEEEDEVRDTHNT